MTPVNRLPPELLIEVFLKVVGNPYIEDEELHTTTLGLARVCSLWYSICISTPQLWNCIYDCMSAKIINVRLERSKSVPLHVKCVGYDGRKAVEVQFLDIIVPHISRWETCSISTPFAQELASSYLAKKSMLALKTLRIDSCRSVPPYEDSFAPLDISAPSLWELNVFSLPYPLHLESGIQLNLRKIRFMPNINGVMFSPEHYRLLFTSAPHLEDIRIDGKLDAPPPTAYVESTFHVQLPNLRTIHLSYLHWTTINMLLSSISAGQAHQYPVFSITVMPLPHPFPPVFSDVTGLDCLLATIRNSEWLSATIEGDGEFNDLYFRLGIGQGPMKKALLRLELSCEEEEPGQIISHLIASGCFRKVTVVELEGIRVFRSGEFPWSNMSLPSLEILRIRSSWLGSLEEDLNPLRGIIRALSLPVSPLFTTFPCPRLRHIAFDCTVTSEWLMPLLKARGRDIGSAALANGLISPLELVEMSEHNNEWFELVDSPLYLEATKNNIELRYRALSEW